MDAADFEPLHPNDAWLMAQVDQNMFAAAVADGDDGDPIVPQPPVVPGLDQGDDDDRVTYEDSEMFEEDIVSLASDSESAIQNWRGWSGVLPIDCPHPELSATDIQASTSYGYGPPQTLRIMAAKVAALSMSFDQLEAQNDGQPIPSDVFIDVIRQCFPQNSEDIRMYSFLTNASGNEYLNGYQLFNEGCVKKALQIGYHITATVEVTPKQQTQTSDARGRASFGVDISVDRCRIVSCTCSCPFKSSWCQHVVAVCLHRIHHPNKVEYRGTIWDSLNQMSKKNLIKFSQYLINALPRQYLPIAQGLIDDLRNPDSDINQSDGAPDPTDGGHQEHAIWCLDGKVIKDNIHKVLTKICIPGPTVHCDVNCLSNNPLPQSPNGKRSTDP
ncbi:hypothetical protein L596_006041 [Steinernema carpocapsae]|uniref:SWIM-type domain-containing protein n=1 Tax=Steinernema carpocapsae TaxID=34508 RepID=A0A4U8V104_STECR|nr:hypothetical protein L596_006041 [Steinernema carpocapsae]